MPSPVHHSSVQGVGVSPCLHHRVADGLFPNKRAIDGESDLEEERRLFYVATTPGGTFPSSCFPDALQPKRDAGAPHAKSLSEGTARVAVRIAQRSLILSATTGRVERFQAPRQRVRKIVLRVQGQKQSPPSKQGAVMSLGKPND